jgi:hypothetical protein
MTRSVPRNVLRLRASARPDKLALLVADVTLPDRLAATPEQAELLEALIGTEGGDVMLARVPAAADPDGGCAG